MAAAANLLRRAVTLLPERDPSRVELLPDLAEVMTEIGEFAWGEVFLEEAMDAARATNDSQLEAHVTLGRLLIQRFGDDAPWGDEVVTVTKDVIEVLERAEDYAGLAKAYRLLCLVHGTASQWAAFLAAGDRDLHYATLAGDRRARTRAVTARAIAANYGPEPVDSAIAHCEEALELAAGNRRSEGLVMSYLAELEALHGNFDRARELCRNSRAILLDAGAEIQAHGVSSRAGPVELLAGDPAAAVAQLRIDYDALTRLNEIYFACTLAALLAEALYAEGEYAEAEAFTRKAEELAPEDDTWTQAAWRSTRAKLIAVEDGSGQEALLLARQGVELLETTDAPVWRANALCDYATVLDAYGQTHEAQAAFEQALTLYESKAASVPVERTRMRLSQFSSVAVAASASTPRAR
jgi:ATP/maltotriose-dependent transcriptional regulator MalT